MKTNKITTKVNLTPMGEKYMIEQFTNDSKDKDILVSKEELSGFMKKKFSKEELKYMRKALKMFRSTEIIINKGRNEKY